MEKNNLSDLIVLEENSSMINLMSAKDALKKYCKNKGNLEINFENKTWSYGSNESRNLWVPGRFTKKIGDGGKSIYPRNGIAGVYDKMQIRHLKDMIYVCEEIVRES